MTTPDIQSLVESVLRKRASEHTMSVLPSNLPLVSCRRLFVGSLYVAQVDNSDASESDLQADADAIALCWNAAPILATELTRLRAELAEEKRKVEVAKKSMNLALDELRQWMQARNPHPSSIEVAIQHITDAKTALAALTTPSEKGETK